MANVAIIVVIVMYDKHDDYFPMKEEISFNKNCQCDLDLELEK